MISNLYPYHMGIEGEHWCIVEFLGRTMNCFAAYALSNTNLDNPAVLMPLPTEKYFLCEKLDKSIFNGSYQGGTSEPEP